MQIANDSVVGLAHAFTLLVVVFSAAYLDLRWRRIPNLLTGPAIIAGFGINILSGGLRGVVLSVVGLGLGALILLGPVAVRWWGAGDLKLFAALGAIGGPSFIFWAGLFSLAAGGAVAIAMLAAKRQTVTVIAGMAVDLYTRQAPRTTSDIGLPYAVPIAIGTCIAIVWR